MGKATRKDDNAPEVLGMKLFDGDALLFDDITKSRVFSSGSFGYNFSGKLSNKKSGERYQVTCNVILIGSKPAKEA